MKRNFKWLIIIVLIGIGSAAALPIQADDKAAQAYKKAYNLILDQEWQQAEALMSEIIETYPQSQWVDDSRFWKCYADEKTGDSPERAFECYQKFIQTHPKSKWVDDAKSSMIRLGEQLAKMGKPEYASLVESMKEQENQELVIQAIYALQGRNDDRAYEIISNLYRKSDDPELRKKIVFLLGTFNSEKAGEKLVEIAKEDDDPQVRAQALLKLGLNDHAKEMVGLFKTIIQKDPERQVRKNAMMALTQIDDPKATEALVDIARNSSDNELRVRALRALSWQVKHDNAREIAGLLKAFAFDDPNKEVQENAIYAISQLESQEGFPGLVELAQKHPDPDIREKAVFWISQRPEAVEAIDVLKSFALNDTIAGVQEKALFALSQVESEETLPVILQVIEKSDNPNVREKAVFWLGQVKTERDVSPVLRKLVMKDNSPAVQEKALFALSQLEESKGLPVIVDVAKSHQNAELREKAVFWISQTKSETDKETIELLKSFVLDAEHPAIQEKALFGLMNLPDGKGVPALIEITKTHPAFNIRKKALFWLGQSEDERALKAVEDILYQSQETN
ncbi:outer membrane protein assembly factor BamD [candidate division KSB1 bacterium]|nr:outer membrane protein assembly factor BamD [candidate division KSB1 bacterium]